MSGADETCECPICLKAVPLATINQHVDQCLNDPPPTTTTTTTTTTTATTTATDDDGNDSDMSAKRRKRDEPAEDEDAAMARRLQEQFEQELRQVPVKFVQM
jgi:hypothetical protein